MSTLIKIGALEVPAKDWVAPLDRTFRDAWTIKDTASGAIEVDMVKAKDIFRDKLRAARAEVFPALDAAFMKALETGADTSAIAARKQELRDATSDPAINAATTPEELKALRIADLEV
jgi:hypothetical protein